MKQTKKGYEQMVAIGKRADKMAKEFLTPPQEAEWEVAFEHRYYDILKAWEARFVFDLRKDLKSFIRQLLIDDRSKGKV